MSPIASLPPDPKPPVIDLALLPSPPSSGSVIFTSVVGRKEAAEMAAQFVRFGLIALVSDKRKNNDSAIIFTVRGSAPGGSSPVSVRVLSPLHHESNL
jgi:hypothetical protein